MGVKTVDGDWPIGRRRIVKQAFFRYACQINNLNAGVMPVPLAMEAGMGVYKTVYAL